MTYISLRSFIVSFFGIKNYTALLNTFIILKVLKFIYFEIWESLKVGLVRYKYGQTSDF